MKYDMLSLETVRHIWDTFQEHDACINDKYNKFKGKDTYWSSDRERFVGRLFKKYEGRYIAFIDKLVVGYKRKNFFTYATQSQCTAINTISLGTFKVILSLTCKSST